MKKIPSDFTYKKYGLTVRLVQESDAPFILQLRTDAKLSMFVHAVKNDLQGQIKWIREYKEREKKGEDYYFIYFSNNKPIGVNRIYNITQYSSTTGSWICSNDSTMEESIATDFICSEIIDMFDLPQGPYNVSKGNNHVLRYNMRMGAKIIEENETEYTLMCNKEKYNQAKEKLIKLLNL